MSEPRCKRSHSMDEALTCPDCLLDAITGATQQVSLLTTENQILLSSLEKENSIPHHFVREEMYKQVVEQLGREKMNNSNNRVVIGDFQRLINDQHIVLEKEKERADLIQEHANKLGSIISDQTEKRLGLEMEIEVLTEKLNDQIDSTKGWTERTLKTEDKIGELDDRIVSLVILADGYAMRITKAESRLKSSEEIRVAEKAILIKEIEDHTETKIRIKELESQLASIKADESIGKLEVVNGRENEIE